MTRSSIRPLTERFPALPLTAEAGNDGILAIGGCRVTDLALRFGTPLYIYDLETVRSRLRQCVAAMGAVGAIHYAGKAYLARWLLQLLVDEGVGLDVCSGIELALALAAAFPVEHVRLHGNNKREAELRLALESHIGAIVVDNLPELRLLIEIAGPDRQAPILLRLNPGIEAHTHRYLQTGVLDSKFGLPMPSGEAAQAVALALAHPQQIRLLGYHAHIGTQILDLHAYTLLMRTLLDFTHAMHGAHGYWPAQISPGGGIGITYTGESEPGLANWLQVLRAELEQAGGQTVPHLAIEPGRAIIGPAGVALYTVGTIKQVPGGRTYVAVDGGMSDNIRPALYGATYTAIAATRLQMPSTQTVTIAGPYCESGDILVDAAPLPPIDPGDLIALPAAGAYCLPMSSNYNGALRPAVVTVEHGVSRLVQRRQTIEDLVALDLD